MTRKFLILGIILLVLISSGCIEQLGDGLKSIEKTTEVESIIRKPSDQINQKECIEKAKELIPETLEVHGYAGTWEISKNLWKDGSKIEGLSTFYRGKSAEENINILYFYSGLFNPPLKYSKKIISNNGTVLGTRTFSLKPTLIPVEGDNDPFKKYINKKFIFKEYGFVECNWVTDEY